VKERYRKRDKKAKHKKEILIGMFLSIIILSYTTVNTEMNCREPLAVLTVGFSITFLVSGLPPKLGP
jgi:hypothetical protein